MIDLTVDEAYAYDHLSILTVKNVETPSTKNDENFNECLKKIVDQVGKSKHFQIILSTEYGELLETNRSLFHIIEEVRAGHEGLGKKVDDLNMNRYYAKMALQEKFFDSEVSEVKT